MSSINHHHNNNSNSNTKLSFVFFGFPCNSLYYVEYDENDVQSYRKHKRIKLPFPHDRILVVDSCNGLICLDVCLKGICFDPINICNPITRELFMRLPRLIVSSNHKKSYMAFGFGYHLPSNEYKVVRVYYCFDQQRDPTGIVQVYTLGSGIGWRNKGEITHNLQPGIFSSHGVLLNGALHWITMDGNIVAFDLADEEFRCIPTPLCSSLNWNMQSTLWLLGGWLCIFHQRTDTHADIWLLKKKKNAEKKGTSSGYSDMKEQEYQSWSWGREFTITTKGHFLAHQPFAITKSGKILVLSEGKSIVCFDPKIASKKKKLGDLGKAIDCIEAISHFNSFVSLKALGENAEIL